jgi:hypothetical protein
VKFFLAAKLHKIYKFIDRCFDLQENKKTNSFTNIRICLCCTHWIRASGSIELAIGRFGMEKTSIATASSSTESPSSHDEWVPDIQASDIQASDIQASGLKVPATGLNIQILSGQ